MKSWIHCKTLQFIRRNFIVYFNFFCSYSLYVFVRLNQHVMTAQDAQSFLSMTYASVLVQVKRNFDKFMQLQLQSIQEAKVPKRSKCGLICFVENFEEFAVLIEGIFRNSERRTDLDKWYVKIVEAIFQGKFCNINLIKICINKFYFISFCSY